MITVIVPEQLSGTPVSFQLTNILGQETYYSLNTEFQTGQNLLTLPSELNGIYLFTVKVMNSR
ncbi:MAG: T9SS type A sorting domain-containing protein [Crocinitomicaceae bacterium]|nr:T9SS type A sorting domain-containing protein [Crocinitomicaceae bacterium]